jgi:chaperonin cofactor prefoldin
MSPEKVMEIIVKFIANEQNMKSVVDICVTRATDNMRDNLNSLQDNVSTNLNTITSTKESLEKRIANLESQMSITNLHMDLLRRKLDDTEQYTRRPNLIIDGVFLRKNESPKALRNFIVNEINSLGIDVHDEDIDRLHRHEEPYKDGRGDLIQPIIIRMTTWYARNELYSARHDFRFRLRADLTARRQQILDFARDHVAINKLDRLVDFIAADRNCRLILRTTAGVFQSFSSESELTNIIDLLVAPNCRREYNKYSKEDFRKFMAEKGGLPPSPSSQPPSPSKPVSSFASVLSPSTSGASSSTSSTTSPL